MFGPTQLIVAEFGYGDPALIEDYEGFNAWRVSRHPRFVVDLTGDGHADIVGFGDDGVWVALNSGGAR